MTDPISNDNAGPPDSGLLSGPDAHGQAAMLLVESVIHGLIAKSVFSTREAIDIVGTAIDVKEEVADELGDSAATMQKSLAILAAIRTSLKHDEPEIAERPAPSLS